MTALEIKHHLLVIDNKIIRILTKAKYKNLTGNTVKLNVETDGSVMAILQSINNYDETVLSQLVLKSSNDINDRVLRIYSKTKKKLEVQMRKRLHVLRNVKARIKNGR